MSEIQAFVNDGHDGVRVTVQATPTPVAGLVVTPMTRWDPEQNAAAQLAGQYEVRHAETGLRVPAELDSKELTSMTGLHRALTKLAEHYDDYAHYNANNPVPSEVNDAWYAAVEEELNGGT